MRIPKFKAMRRTAAVPRPRHRPLPPPPDAGTYACSNDKAANIRVFRAIVEYTAELLVELGSDDFTRELRVPRIR